PEVKMTRKHYEPYDHPLRTYWSQWAPPKARSKSSRRSSFRGDSGKHILTSPHRTFRPTPSEGRISKEVERDGPAANGATIEAGCERGAAGAGDDPRRGPPGSIRSSGTKAWC